MAESKINDIIRTSLSGLKDMIDIETIMGEPIKTDNGITIIPISKVSVGLASGGLDYFGKNLPVPERNPVEKLGSFGGGGGTGVTLTPVGFLVIKPNGSVELLSVAAASSASTAVGIIDTVADLIERSPELVGKLKTAFGKDKKEDLS